MQAWRPIQYGEIMLMESDLINDLSQKYGKTYSQIAVNRLISQKNISTIIKMTKEEHIRENL